MKKTLENIVGDQGINDDVITHEIECRFCGATTGKIDLPKAKYEGVEITDASLGLDDSRCDVCTLKYGTIQDMRKEYEQKMPNASEQEFRTMLAKNGFKKDGFFTEVKTESDKRTAKIRKDQEDKIKKDKEKVDPKTDTGPAGN